jgi:serine/threonine protein kinase
MCIIPHDPRWYLAAHCTMARLLSMDACDCACRGKQIALDIATGLNYLHEHNILHSDLKSANILLTSTLRAKCGDFGMAAILSHTTASINSECASES